MDTELEERDLKKTQKEDSKKAKLLKSFENNLKISGLNLNNKFDSFEDWELTKSNRLLYEIGRTKNTYKRFPRGSIVKVDFGVNIGNEFSEQHFAITLTKQDNPFNGVLTVIPLTSKKHKKALDLGSLIVDMYLANLQLEVEKIQAQLEEIDIKNCEWDQNYIKEMDKIEKILSYYKKTKNNLSYACIDQIKTVSKLNVLPPINEYDIVGKGKCDENVMKLIDKEIIRVHTGINFPEFEKWFDNIEN